jgi:hypothetical protein
MGQMLFAICNNCGFQQQFSFGAGMDDHLTRCSVPAMDKQTGEFVVKNYFEKDSFNGQFIFYNESEMYHMETNRKFIQWKEVLLKRTENLCTNCLRFTMSFEYGPCFD